MTGEHLIQMEEVLNSLEHTRKCITENLVNGIPCNCGLEKMRETFLDYRKNLWRENREF